MQCFAPISKKATGVTTLKGPMVQFPCGKCAACRSNLRDSWKFRLQKEADFALSSWFITLTYSDETVPSDGVDKTHLQLYLKRFRKRFPDVKIRYYAIGEYGGTTSRPHYHMCVFLDVMEFKPENFEIDWHSGHVHVCLCSPATIGYIANYHTVKQFSAPAGKNPAFSLMSRKPGLGAEWIEKYGKQVHDQFLAFTYIAGSPYSIPRYYKDKIYEPWEKTWLAKQFQAISDRKYLQEVSKYGSEYFTREIASNEAKTANLKYKSNNKI